MSTVSSGQCSGLWRRPGRRRFRSRHASTANANSRTERECHRAHLAHPPTHAPNANANARTEHERQRTHRTRTPTHADHRAAVKARRPGSRSKAHLQTCALCAAPLRQRLLRPGQNVGAVREQVLELATPGCNGPPPPSAKYQEEASGGRTVQQEADRGPTGNLTGRMRTLRHPKVPNARETRGSRKKRKAPDSVRAEPAGWSPDRKARTALRQRRDRITPPRVVRRDIFTRWGWWGGDRHVTRALTALCNHAPMRRGRC